MAHWSVADSYRLYRMENWAEGYFNVNNNGHLFAKFASESEQNLKQVDLYELAQQLKRLGLTFPVLVRFGDILSSRVARLHGAFNKAITKHEYKGSYVPVYPIKVNQQHTVVTRLLTNNDLPVGLEAGSKPELMACIALASKPMTIICNGYKDKEFIRLALMAQLLGHSVFLVIEKPSELEFIAEQSNILNIKPKLGVRVRLASLGAGNWQNTGGEKSKFGLSATGVLELLAELKRLQLFECLELLHFHMGSQIANITHFSTGIQEAMCFYSEISRQGVCFKYLDVGGGLAVDYDGTASKSFFSMNYHLEEYADTFISQIKQTCASQNLPEPTVITEAGRAMTAHHGFLIVEVIDKEIKPEASVVSAEVSAHPLSKELHALSCRLDASNAVVVLREIDVIMEKLFTAFSQGEVRLSERAQAENYYFQICRRVFAILKANPKGERDTYRHLSELLADKYFCNFSIFQSTPDVWGIDQIFPIVPLHRLQEAPLRRVLLKDLTCDSDGRIDDYVDGEGISCTLAMHELRDNEEYLLGIFLVGAYQEILGDMHNLFGDTHSVDVSVDAAGGIHIANIERGDTVSQVLDSVHYDADDMIESYDQQILNAGIRSGLTGEQQELLRTQFLASLRSYTYLRDKPKTRSAGVGVVSDENRERKAGI